MATFDELHADVLALSDKLRKRGANARSLDRYREGDCPIPDVIVRAGVTKAYRMLTPVSDAPFGSVVVDAVQDRLEVVGIRSGDKALDDLVWEDWQANEMDSESKLGHDSALTGGRAFALVWADDSGEPEITLENQEQMIVRYRPGSRRHRRDALRRWNEGNTAYATLYRPDGIYKFVAPQETAHPTVWEKRQPMGEDWPLDNPLGVVPVVELAVNRRLKPGEFGYARGEYEHCTGLMDRINLLTFLGLVVAFWMGFPLRGVIGQKLNRVGLVDDEGAPLIDEATGKQATRVEPPFDVHADSLFQLEDKDAKLAEFAAADRKNLSVFMELDQLAAVTKTPRHYFPIGDGISNIAEPTIRAFEGGLNAKCESHMGSLGSGWLEVNRLSALIRGKVLPRTAQMLWADHESRSLAERADAATKLAALNLPPLFIAERFLNLGQDELRRLDAAMAGNVLSQLITAANAPTPPPEPVVQSVPA